MRIFLTSALFGALTLIGPSLSGQALSGRRAPSFSLPDSSQVQHDILDYRGKWLLLTFTTTMNCQRCAPLARELEKLQSAKIGVLSVMITPPENANTAARFVAENKLTSPIVFDQSQVAIGYFKATPANPRIDTPHLFAINPAGMIVQDWPDSAVGTMLAAKGGVAAAIQALIAAAPK
jgi:peroxiredoxin